MTEGANTDSPNLADLGLESVKPFDLRQVQSPNDFFQRLSETPFDGHLVGKAVELFSEMVADKNIFRVLTISGAMTPAKMGLIIRDMVETGMVHLVVSTGAIMCHGLTESIGGEHKRVPDNKSDEELWKMRQNRIYTVTEPESNLNDLFQLYRQLFKDHDPSQWLYSQFITDKFGEYLHNHSDKPAILKSAYEKGVPVIIPALTDSELGLDHLADLKIRDHLNLPRLAYNPFIDLEIFEEIVRAQIKVGKKLGIFTIGGGVPRNYAQEIAPCLDLIDERVADELGKEFDHFADPPMYDYGIRICPEPVNLGGLSGCTYSEGISWGKMRPGGKFIEVPFDATLAWPLIMYGVVNEIGLGPFKSKAPIGRKFLDKVKAQVVARYPRLVSS